MSQSLSQSFSKLTVTPAAPTKMQLPYPTLSDVHADPKGRACFYGYDISQDWLIEYAKANHARGRYSWELMSQVVDILIAKTGIRTLETETALVNPTVPGDTIIRGNRPEEPMVPLLAICCNAPKSLRRRPSQAQVDQLSLILGRQPRWWIDYELPSSYQ
ncbi:hypothetical protein BYT27DRAFT_7243362 [Phlegmacium glaucopus]|nr:hypothetical protein BYT27DRAFT_7243362 [Phlegmacium glaucopus]